MTDYQRLKTYFKSIDLSQTKISDELGVSIQYINAVLNGRDNLTITFIKKVHDKYLNLNIDWLITGRGEINCKWGTTCVSRCCICCHNNSCQLKIKFYYCIVTICTVVSC